jgi:riboflavin kinase / FMN adenylyltransferase
LWVGSDFALGRNRAGNTDVLRALGAERGWTLRVVEPVAFGGEPVSSTRIRSLFEHGRNAEAL